MFTNNQLVSMDSLIHLFGDKMIVSNYIVSPRGAYFWLFVNIRVIRG